MSAQLFAQQSSGRAAVQDPQGATESRVQHKLPPYVQHMDRLGDSELWVHMLILFYSIILSIIMTHGEYQVHSHLLLLPVVNTY